MNPYLTGRVSAGAIRHNLSLLRGCVGPRVKICCVVKADAYGHGLDLLWPLLAERLNPGGWLYVEQGEAVQPPAGSLARRRISAEAGRAIAT